MTIGLSIKSAGLRKDTTKEERQIHLAGFSNLFDYLTFLKVQGVRSIELRIYKRDDSYELFADAIGLILEQGFELTIHGDLTGEFRIGKSFVDVYPSLEKILLNKDLQQTKIIMPIHAYQAINLHETTLKRESVHMLKQWTSLVEDGGFPLYFALENNREKAWIDPCNHLQGVMDIVQEISSDHLGVCFDMGHYYSNLLHNKVDKDQQQVLLPFVDRVIHTHIHGLNEEKVTHCPLVDPGSLPLETYVGLLQDANYSGVYNLELSFDRWNGNVQEDLTRSIQRLKQAVNTNKAIALVH